MFDQNKIIRLPVTLTLTNGEKLNGMLLLSRAQKLLEVLSKPEPFIEFETRDGQNLVLSKSSILSAALLDERKGNSGTEQLRKPERYDPHAILGLASNADVSEIRPAYVEKARQYHPDQFAGRPLPPEVVDYLEAMFTLVQRAYDDLSAQAKPSAA